MEKEASEIERPGVKDGSKTNSKTNICHPCCQIFCSKGWLGFSMCESTVLLSTLINNSVVSGRQNWREFSMQQAHKIVWKLSLGGKAEKSGIDHNSLSLNKIVWEEMWWLQVHNRKQWRGQGGVSPLMSEDRTRNNGLSVRLDSKGDYKNGTVSRQSLFCLWCLNDFPRQKNCCAGFNNELRQPCFLLWEDRGSLVRGTSQLLLTDWSCKKAQCSEGAGTWHGAGRRGCPVPHISTSQGIDRSRLQRPWKEEKWGKWAVLSEGGRRGGSPWEGQPREVNGGSWTAQE